MRTIFVGAIMSLLGIALAVFISAPSLRAEATSQNLTQIKAKTEGLPAIAPAPACPMCSLMRGAETCEGMSAAMKQQCDMRMNAELSKYDAPCLLALKQELKFTPEQVKQLERIVQEARQKGAAVLTLAQQKSLPETTPNEPTTLCKMHNTIHKARVKVTDSSVAKSLKTSPTHVR